MSLKVTRTAIPDVLVIEPTVFRDDRGFLVESYNEKLFRESTGLDVSFVQDNHSRSAGGVLRGLHYQIGHGQGKLLRATAGEVFDVAVDLRRSSPTFGRWVGEYLSADNFRQLWIPAGFAHGFLVLSDYADVQYKITVHRHAESERALKWDDPTVGVEWPLAGVPVLSLKDASAPLFNDVPYFD